MICYLSWFLILHILLLPFSVGFWGIFHIIHKISFIIFPLIVISALTVLNCYEHANLSKLSLHSPNNDIITTTSTFIYNFYLTKPGGAAGYTHTVIAEANWTSGNLTFYIPWCTLSCVKHLVPDSISFQKSHMIHPVMVPVTTSVHTEDVNPQAQRKMDSGLIMMIINLLTSPELRCYLSPSGIHKLSQYSQ